MKLYLTAKDSDFRLSEVPVDDLRKGYQQDGNITYTDAGELFVVYLDDRKTFQEWEGFGGAFTESAANVLNRMSSTNQRKMMEAYFHPEKGIGYNFCRTHINSCDFSLGNWACCETEDPELNEFTLERDKQQIIPMIHWAKALSEEEITIFSSPWSPPAWMKTNGEMNNGGQLKPEYRQSWALYYCKYIKAMEDEGVTVSAITVQNEPAATQVWDSCVYTAEEERDFVRDYLGPTLEQEGLGHIKIVCWDHNRAEAYDRAQKMFDDADASKYVYGIGIHWYMGDNYDNLKLVNDIYPDKKIWFTEGCQEFGPHIGEWQVGERYAHSMINDLNHNTSAWCDWNLFLDETGGPNHVNNLCSAPVIGDTLKDEVIYNPSYYYFGHFSKFIKRGAYRVAIATTSDDLEATAFLNPNGEKVVVIMNRLDRDVVYALNNLERGCYVKMPARSIQTLIID
ncbi:glycoside hydrolase family 30 protein [Photobacterium alginatilyticum]|uniref:Glucosylceramidase n=1 Tax=Photobacterium alginatilyticum TaxID=1775171 RepID=A0ABW9YLF8_9GAMM|nr:glycoside hydrolase family 30 protein [Photobacterium alginatilyticum]NBI54048.1 glucosylceramidase [Photobacterium alginatilyticum]